MADPASTPTARPSQKSLPTLATELWELIVTYLKQETLEPLKGLGRFVLLGLGGALLLAIGLVVLAVAGLRALQVETRPHWTGSWSWLPYVITIVGAGIVAGLVASRIGAARRKRGR